MKNNSIVYNLRYFLQKNLKVLFLTFLENSKNFISNFKKYSE